MASTHQSLLNPSTVKNNSTNSVKIFLSISTSLAILICIATIATIFHPYHVEQPQPSDLCIGSPNPSSCHTIVAASIKSKGQVQTPSEILMILADESLQLLAKTIIVTGTDTTAAVATDCIELLDISQGRLHDVVSAIRDGAYTDARTWLSAVLTNYGTCLDGFTGLSTSSPRLKAHLKSLSELASASLAVLNALQPNSNVDIEKPILKDFPSWMIGVDEKSLEDFTGGRPAYVNVTVAGDGSGNFKKLQDAVDSAPNKGKSRYVIYVKRGIYYENVNLNSQKTNVMIVGDGMDATIISGSRSIEKYTTFNTATLAATGDNFILQDICIENTAGPSKDQAVALRVGSDRSVMNRCQIRAYQDTLYAHTLRQFYRDCLVLGTIDFIFGNAVVVLQNCTLMTRLPLSNQQNLVTAQGRTDPNQNTGTSIQKCRIVPSDDLIPKVSVIPSYLGRPWKEFSRTVYLQSYLGGHIRPEGWFKWQGTDFALNTLYYGEYNNFGPGAGLKGRVKWTGYHVITDPAVASSFTVGKFIQGGEWLKSTGVEFVEGL